VTATFEFVTAVDFVTAAVNFVTALDGTVDVLPVVDIMRETV
jgi:hypothetical protein